MSRPIKLDHLSADEWQALDRQLDQLLDLDRDAQQAAIATIEDKDPASAAILRRLLDAQAADQRIDASLLTALSFLSEREPVASNTRIGAWRLIRRIGQGGMAEVYLAERADGAFEQTVALKLLWPGLCSPGAGHLVRQERQILAAMDDVRIARLVDGGLSEEGRPWLAMEYVRGEPVTHYCDRLNLDRTARLTLFLDVADGVAAAHRQLVVHGDIKPDHVVVTEDGQIKLLDFGIGRLLEHRPGAHDDNDRWRALTPDYASPEQRDGKPPSPASDVYQLGLLLRRLFAGRADGRGLADRELQAIVDHALAHRPQDRYLGPDHLARDLRALLGHSPVRAFGDGPLYRARCLLRRQWPGISLAALILLLGSAALVNQFDQARKLAEGNAANEAVMAYLEDLLMDANPYLTEGAERLSRGVLVDAADRLDAEMLDQPRAKARVLNVLGEVHRVRSELILARERHERALALAQRHDLPDAMDRARAGLATIGIWAGDYAASENMMRHMLDEHLRRFAADSEAVATVRLTLADLLHSRGDYQASAAQINEVRQTGKLSNWSDRLWGMLVRDRGQLSAADAVLRQAVERERRLGLQTEAIHSATLDHHAVTLIHRGDVEQALRVLDQSDFVRRGLQGEDWDGLVWTRHWRALAHLSRGDMDTAAQLMDQMIWDYQRFFSESSHLLAFARSDRAWVALAQGQPENALIWFGQAIERIEAIQKLEHPRLAEMLIGQSLASLAQGRVEAARLSAARAFAIRQQLLSADSPSHDWLINSCRVLRWAGGQCALTTNENEYINGLDQQRIKHAVAGLCAASATHPLSLLPCDSAQ